MGTKGRGGVGTESLMLEAVIRGQEFVLVLTTYHQGTPAVDSGRILGTAHSDCYDEVGVLRKRSE